MNRTRTPASVFSLASPRRAPVPAHRAAPPSKNWLFCGSDNGGHTAAVLFSFIATCQRHKVDPFAYLRAVLTRIAATPLSQLDQLLPDRWQATQPAITPAN